MSNKNEVINCRISLFPADRWFRHTRLWDTARKTKCRNKDTWMQNNSFIYLSDGTLRVRTVSVYTEVDASFSRPFSFLFIFMRPKVCAEKKIRVPVAIATTRVLARINACPVLVRLERGWMQSALLCSRSGSGKKENIWTPSAIKTTKYGNNNNDNNNKTRSDKSSRRRCDDVTLDQRR